AVETREALGDTIDRRARTRPDQEVDEQAEQQADPADPAGDGDGVPIDLVLHSRGRPGGGKHPEKLALEAYLARGGQQLRARRRRVTLPVVERPTAGVGDAGRSEGRV